jgi:hypothetical protein
MATSRSGDLHAGGRSVLSFESNRQRQRRKSRQFHHGVTPAGGVYLGRHPVCDACEPGTGAIAVADIGKPSGSAVTVPDAVADECDVATDPG